MSELKKLFTFLLLCAAFSCSVELERALEDEVQTLELHYIAWGSERANWVRTQDFAKYELGKPEELAKSCIFIEAALPDVELPDTLGFTSDVIKFTGRFYQDLGYPKGYESFQNPEKARVFRYTNFEVVSSSYRYLTEEQREYLESAKFK